MAENKKLRDDSKNKNDFGTFWNGIETMTGSNIPMYIRDVLNQNGYNSPLSLELLEEEDICDMEAKIRNSVRKTTEKSESDPGAKFIDAPFESKEEFYFPKGYRKQLLRIAQWIRERGAENVLLNLRAPVQASSNLCFINKKGPTCTLTSQTWQSISFHGQFALYFFL